MYVLMLLYFQYSDFLEILGGLFRFCSFIAVAVVIAYLSLMVEKEHLAYRNLSLFNESIISNANVMLAVLDLKGKPTARFDTVKAAKVARLTSEEWSARREEMIKICIQCHSKNYAATQFMMADGVIRDADNLMAEAIRIVGGLYRDGLLKKDDRKTFSRIVARILLAHDVNRVWPQGHLLCCFTGSFEDRLPQFGMAQSHRHFHIKDRHARILAQGPEGLACALDIFCDHMMIVGSRS
jgi:hypothetical protein